MRNIFIILLSIVSVINNVVCSDTSKHVPWKLSKTLFEWNGGYRSLEFNPQDTVLAGADDLGSLILWDVATGTKKETFKFRTQVGPYYQNWPSVDISHSHDGKLLAALSTNWRYPAINKVMQLEIWDLASGDKIVDYLFNNPEFLEVVEFTPDNSRLRIVDQFGRSEAVLNLNDLCNKTYTADVASWTNNAKIHEAGFKNYKHSRSMIMYPRCVLFGFLKKSRGMTYVASEGFNTIGKGCAVFSNNEEMFAMSCWKEDVIRIWSAPKQ
jgi:WD40 repeat protein